MSDFNKFITFDFENYCEKRAGQNLKNMNEKPQWFLIETEQEYENAVARYETVKHATTGADHKEKLLLVHLIADYENRSWDHDKPSTFCRCGYSLEE